MEESGAGAGSCHFAGVPLTNEEVLDVPADTEEGQEIVEDPNHITRDPERVQPNDSGVDEDGILMYPWHMEELELVQGMRAPWARGELDPEVDLFDTIVKSHPWGTRELASLIRDSILQGYVSPDITPALDTNEILAAMGRGIYDLQMVPARNLLLDVVPSAAMPPLPHNWEAR